MLNFLKDVLANTPKDWLNLTTHRLDIYEEKLAKTQFLQQFEQLFNENDASQSALLDLPTAFDYIRLGHPLSCVLEWAIAKQNDVKPDEVVSFASNTVPILAILRANLLSNKKTRVIHQDSLPASFDVDTLREVYGYNFEILQVSDFDKLSGFEGSTVFVSRSNKIGSFEIRSEIDFYVQVHPGLGSVLLVNGSENASYISEIQHVRRREAIAMTPADCLDALRRLAQVDADQRNPQHFAADKASVLESIQNITAAKTKALVASSGLSIQYAILMGLIDYSFENHKGKAIKIIVPPNCYGGTNDQARRVAACIENVEVLDLPVDGGNDMVQGIEKILTQVAAEDAVPYIIAEIPTNPRVEVPDLQKLRATLSKVRFNQNGESVVDPVFILDQTFCPNVHFLGDDDVLSGVRTISFASGSKFPSGGLCTAGYCVGNAKAATLMTKIEAHLQLCDNEATALQMEILAKQLPSMNQRIQDAYQNTRKFVNYIQEVLPAAKINFVSEELAKDGFTPSVFSLDLPTKGDSEEEREEYKRALNLKLINLMITEIPNESKYCVSYGQLKGCYWTIPATSTQGTTKEGDKDYIARVALSPNLDLELHKKVFLKFVEGI